LFAQHFLAKFRPDKVIAFECCWTCSKPLPGEFGGAAWIVRADGYRSVSTVDLCRMLAEGTPAEKIPMAIETRDMRADLERAGRWLLDVKDGALDDNEWSEIDEFILRHVPHEGGDEDET
jgi:hypothetical protein